MAMPKQRGDREYFRFFQDNVAYTNDAGTAVPIGTFVGGQYNSTAPTYTDGDPGVLQLTSDGRLKVDTDITLTDIDVQIGSVELKDATSDTRAVVKSDGTNNALVVTMNALPSLTAGSAAIGSVTVSSLSALVEGTATIGSVKLTDGAETLQIATDGAAVKTKGIMFMGTDGTNSQTVSMNSDGDVNIADGGNVITVDGSGTAGTAATGVITIQGIASMTAVQVADNSSSLTVDLLSEYVDGAAWTTESSRNLLVGGIYQATPQTVATGTVAPIEIDVNGKIIESNSNSIKAAVEIMDDWDDSNYCNVNLNLAGTDAQAGEGAISNNTLRVSLATDDDGVASLGIMDDWDNGASDGASVSGDVLHDTADAGEPVKIGGKASNAVPTAVSATADRVNAYFDMNGYLMVGIGDGVDRALVDGSGNLMVSLGTEIAGEDVTNDYLMVGGNVAEDANAAAAKYPVLVAGRYDATARTLDDTDVGAVAVDASGKVITSVPTTLTGGNTTVTTAGTAVALGSALAIRSVYIRAKAANTGTIYVGDSNVDKDTSQQIILAPNDSVTLEIADRATVYIDASVSLEGVDYCCMS